MPPKLSFNQYCNARRGFREDVELIARAGIPGIGVHRSKLEAYGIEKGVRLLRDAGLEPASYAAAGRFLLPGQRSAMIEDAKRTIETTAKLGASCLVLISGPRGDLEWDEANARFIDALHEVLPVAEQHGVRLAYEPISPLRVTVSYIHLLGDALDVVEQVGSPYFGVAVDIGYHWWQRDFAQNLLRGRDKIFLVQICDQDADSYSMLDRAPLGEGVIPLRKVLRAIRATGYDGFYDIEVFSTRFTDSDHATLPTRSKVAFDRLWREGKG